MGIIISDLSSRWKNPILHYSNRGLIIAIWGGLVILLFFYNFQKAINNALAPTAKITYGHSALLGALDWKVRVDDLLILDGINTIPFYLDRYQKRNYLSLHAFLKKYRKMEKEEKEIKLGKKTVMNLAAPVPPPDPWQDLSDVFQTIWKHHRKVWALSESIEENDAWREKLERMMDLPKGRLLTFFHQYELTPVEYHGRTYFYEIVKPSPSPTPTEKEIRLTPAPVDLNLLKTRGRKK